MDNDSANATLPYACQPIDEKTFDLGCLAPAFVIIFILACLKRRSNLKHDYCNGYPGLLIPINFLGSFSNRFTIAATFGATASTFFTNAKSDLFAVPGPAWVKVFTALIAVLVYGILFYPFFACLTTEYKLVGSCLGFLYVTMRFSFALVIDFQCKSSYEGDEKAFQYLNLLGEVPTNLCLLFIAVRFAVLLFLEVRQKWFQSTNDMNRPDRTGNTCLIKQPGIIHVKQLINPGLTSRDVVEEKWYKRLIYGIYRPRPDFEFSTQLISTLVVAVIILFQLLINVLAAFDFFKKIFLIGCANDDSCKSIFRVLFGGLQGGYIVAAFIAILILLHFMKCHRDHVLQLYRGQTTFSQDVFVSPANLVGRSLRFSGYQIAYVVTGNTILGAFLALAAVILGLFFKYEKEIFSPEMLQALKGAGLALLPTVSMAVFLWLFQLFLARFVFRDRDFPNITITVDNRRLFSIMSYFFFFYNILLGVFSCLMRILKGMILGVVFLSRIDRTSLMQGFQTWDQAFVAYLGFTHLLVAHSHPVMLMFCQLLINRNKDRQFEGSLEERPTIPSKQRAYLKDPGSAVERVGLLTDETSITTYVAHPRELRLPRMSHKAINRWFVAVTLLRNPSLIKYRQQGGVRSIVTLGSIQNDSSTLI